MTSNQKWTREQLMVAFALYCQIPFGKLHSRNPEIIQFANAIGRTPSALAMKLSNIASLDPVITSSGRKGLSGASLADKMMWEEMQSDWACFAGEAESILRDVKAGSSDNSEVAPVDEETDYTGMNKEITTTTRVGQSFFRRAVLSAYDYKCSFTGLSMPRLLVASHIVPWRKDATNRLNPRNGLALSVLHDKAFDLGIITVNEDLTIRVSKSQTVYGDEFLKSSIWSYAGKPMNLPSKFLPSEDFLRHHRESIFKE